VLSFLVDEDLPSDRLEEPRVAAYTLCAAPVSER